MGVTDFLREAGYPRVAKIIEDIGPEQEAAFDAWLSDPENKAAWEAALLAPRTRWTSPGILMPELIDADLSPELRQALRDDGLT